MSTLASVAARHSGFWNTDDGHLILGIGAVVLVVFLALKWASKPSKKKDR